MHFFHDEDEVSGFYLVGAEDDFCAAVYAGAVD